MRNKWTLELSLIGPDGKQLTKAIDIQTDDYDSIMEPQEPPSEYFDTFDSAIYKMRRREERRKIIRGYAAKLAGALNDHLEDQEGWHGPNRQEKVNRVCYK